MTLKPVKTETNYDQTEAGMQKTRVKKKKRRKIFCNIKKKDQQNIPSRKHFSRKSNTKYEQTTLNYVTDLIKH